MNQDEQLAEELDALLTAVRAGGSPAFAPGRRPDLGLAAALVELAATLEPDPTFATDLEARLRARAASTLPLRRPRPTMRAYTSPHTSPHTSRGPHPRRAWAAVAALLGLALLLLAIPQAQAGVERLIRIGAVRIGLVRPTSAPGATPTPTPLPSLLDLAGETTLAQARSAAGFPLRLPAYPPDLGPPDGVYLQNLDGPMVVFVWLDRTHPGQVRLGLFELSSNLYVIKSGARIVAQTTVDGQQAVWTEGPYLLEVLNGAGTGIAERIVVQGHTLLWAEHGITYRLETGLTLDEAVRIAQSLR